MARRRKIPARKHHGVRDPLKQKAALEEKLKNVINNPPAKDDQKVSHKFSQFMELMNDTGNQNRLKKSVKKDRSKDITQDSNNKDSGAIRQLPNETDLNYMRRVNRITTQSLREAEYEAKYGVSVIRDNETGEISVKKRPLNEIDELLKKKTQRNRNKKVAPANTMDKKTAKELIKQAIREDNEERKKDTNVEEYKKDIVKFGEVVHGPPSLTVLPRKAVKMDTVPRPGKKTNLLLREILKNADGLSNIVNKPKKISSNQISKNMLKGRRRDLPIATRAMLEVEQSKIVDLYREIKKNKQKF